MAEKSRIPTVAADPFSQQPTSFIGRRREIQELDALLAEPASSCRLLTLDEITM